MPSTTTETTVEGTTPLRIPQPHGGSLNAGGTPGNKGGRGRVPSALRRAARESLADRIALLGEIADGVTEIPLREKCPDCGYMPTGNARVKALRNRVRPRDQVRAIAELATIGMSANVS